MRVLYRLIGLFAAVAGTILAAKGPGVLASVAGVLLGHAGFVLIGAAIAALLCNLAPEGAVAGPAVLALAGAAVLAWQHKWWSARSVWAAAGLALVFIGGALVLRKRPEVAPTDPAPSLVAVVMRRCLVFVPDESAPELLRLVAVAARLDVDLRRARPPVFGPMEVFVSCWQGTVRLELPDNWALVAGRMTAARSISFKGALDTSEVFPDPHSEDKQDKLAQLIEDRQKLVGATEKGTAVVVHVLGVRGLLSVARSNA